MKRVVILVLSAAIMLAAASCGKQDRTAASPTTQKAVVRQTVDAFGTIEARNIESITIDFPSVIEKINVVENQKVKTGDVLASINTDEYKTQIKSKQLELKAMQSEISRIQKDIKKKKDNIQKDSDPDIRKLLNDYNNAQNLFINAQNELLTKQELLKAGTIPQSELDEFKKLVDAKKKDMEDISFTLETTRLDKQQEIEQLQTSLDQDTLKAATLESDLSIMKEKLAKSYIKGDKIVSDIKSGVVYEIGYTNGEIANQAKKLLSIADLDSIVVVAEVPEDFIKDVKIGATATIVPVADSSRKFTGRVTGIANKAFQKNGETLVAVDITVDNKDKFLLPGFNVNVGIDMKQE